MFALDARTGCLQRRQYVVGADHGWERDESQQRGCEQHDADGARELHLYDPAFDIGCGQPPQTAISAGNGLLD
jgi:hypothetical protein